MIIRLVKIAKINLISGRPVYFHACFLVLLTTDMTLIPTNQSNSKNVWKVTDLSKTYDIQDRSPIPHWKNVIANNANKAALLNFIAESWMENARSLPQGFKLILGGMLCCWEPQKPLSFQNCLARATRRRIQGSFVVYCTPFNAVDIREL